MNKGEINDKLTSAEEVEIDFETEGEKIVGGGEDVILYHCDDCNETFTSGQLSAKYGPILGLLMTGKLYCPKCNVCKLTFSGQ